MTSDIQIARIIDRLRALASDTAISRFDAITPEQVARLKKKAIQDRWRAKKRAERKIYWREMFKRQQAGGDAYANRMTWHYRGGLIRKAIHEALGYTNLQKARAAKAAKRAARLRQAQAEVWGRSA